MAIKLVKQNFTIDKLQSLKIGKYYCRLSHVNTKTNSYGDIYVGYFDRSSNEPTRISMNISGDPFDLFIYKGNLYTVDRKDAYTDDEIKVLIKHQHYKGQEKFKKIRKEIELFESLDTKIKDASREPIPETVRFLVWRRDEGKCIQCSSNKNLEFDHIIPFSQGGSNTERNLQLLCEKCNRIKSDKI